MRWRIVTIGRPRLAFARAGTELYASRLSRLLALELRYLKDAGTVEANARRLREATRNCFRVVLDERGTAPDTRGFVSLMERWETSPHEAVAFMVGGADGHDESTRTEADALLALSPLTLQHEIALVVLLEQLYRACTIRRGEPYHR